MAATAWRTNAELIVACRDLGYLTADAPTLDPTWGKGTFWKQWRPDLLVAHDLYTLDGVDFSHLPHGDREFPHVVFDPPYKPNGTPSEPDEAYGVHHKATRAERMQLCLDGIDECARVAAVRLFVKCQDQVCGGRVRWQTREFADRAEHHGFRLRDMLHILVTPRPQPCGTQEHARRNYSTMLVLDRLAAGRGRPASPRLPNPVPHDDPED